MSGSEPRSILRRAAILAALCVGVPGCEDPQQIARDDALAALQAWFQAAEQGERDDRHCHGLGTLKHPELSCADMLAAAATIDNTSRTITRIETMDCFAGVCGAFHQIELASQTKGGDVQSEQALVKRDDGIARVYWYRSDTLMASLRAANPVPDEQEKDPLQAAYDEITARYPALYQFPPCLDVRVSSSNLMTDLMPRDGIDVNLVERLAGECGDAFCFGLVGNKIAAVCPAG